MNLHKKSDVSEICSFSGAPPYNNRDKLGSYRCGREKIQTNGLKEQLEERRIWGDGIDLSDQFLVLYEKNNYYHVYCKILNETPLLIIFMSILQFPVWRILNIKTKTIISHSFHFPMKQILLFGYILHIPCKVEIEILRLLQWSIDNKLKKQV